MHIVHVLTRLLRAGSEENTLATCRWQAAQGHRVTLIHGRSVDPYWFKHFPAGVTRINVSALVHPIRPHWDAIAFHQMKHLYQELNPDVIHTHQSKAGVIGRLAARAVPQTKVVHGIHILPAHGHSRLTQKVTLSAEKRAAQNTDVFIAVSRAVARHAEAVGTARNAHVVYSGMPLDRFRDKTPPADWPKLLGVSAIKPRPPVVLMMAAFEPRKQQAAFLRAFAKVAHQQPNLKLVLAGQGSELPKCRAAVHQLDIAEQVVFAGHRSDPESLFALADLVVLTSRQEGLPRVAVQAMAAGRPMIVQDLPGIDEIIQHQVNGCILPQNDMDAVAKKVMALMNDCRERERLQRGAQNTDVSAWSLDALGARTTALYGLRENQTWRRAA